MNSKERILTVLNGGIPDRIPKCEISFWPETVTRWHKEGLPETITVESGSSLFSFEMADYFGLDKITGFSFDSTLRLEKRVINETADYIIETDVFGATVKTMKNSYTPPVHIDYSIKTMDDWLKNKNRLSTNKTRIDDNYLRQYYKTCRDNNAFMTLNPFEPTWFIYSVLGFEKMLTAMVEQPDMIIDMLDTYTDFIISMSQLTLDQGYVFDAVWFFSDLCYKNGMLFSPKIYNELVMPYHKKISEFCKSNKLKLMMHCDGDVREFIPLLIKSGFDCIEPLEARCGNDVHELKKLFGTNITFFGNISADVMSTTKHDIEQEIKTKIPVAKQGGGYIYHSDHSIPPSISFENYKYAIEAVNRYGTY
jgi:uroporphyrinogen decarboxylase